MQRKLDNWWVNGRSAKSVGIAIIVGAVVVLIVLIVAVLRAVTRLPAWAEILISIPAGILFFYWFVKTHEANGFDGPLVPAERKNSGSNSGGGPAA